MHTQELLDKLQREDQVSSSDVEALRDNVLRELSMSVFLAVPLERRDIFAQPIKGWDTVISAFPETQEDVEEMNKCYALSRYAAAVFHSLLVVEHGLIRLGERLSVKDKKVGWDSTYNTLTSLLKNRESVPENLDFGLLEQIKARLDSMKLAWRNKVNHAAGRLAVESTGFTDISAEEVIVACRSFMRLLAERMS